MYVGADCLRLNEDHGSVYYSPAGEGFIGPGARFTKVATHELGSERWNRQIDLKGGLDCRTFFWSVPPSPRNQIICKNSRGLAVKVQW